MFGIGLPELIMIMGIALIVVGPEKLPEMAKSMARIALDLKKTVSDFKENMHEELKDDSGQSWQPPAVEADSPMPALDAVAGPTVAKLDEIAPDDEQTATASGDHGKEERSVG